MLEGEDILKCINELLYEITNINNEILYPKNEKDVKRFEKIVANYQPNSLIYDQENDKWYQYYVKKIKKDNQLFILKYLIDITEIKKAEEKYQNDSLTSVLTRPAILEKIDEEISVCADNDIPFSLAIADIDYFKNVNDTYGHIAGDNVLKSIGNILLKHTSDDSELVGRYGGEEFLLFFKGISEAQVIQKIIGIKKSLEKLVVPHENTTIANITMSFGVYHINNLNRELDYTNNQELMTELIHGADVALYRSKEAGRNLTHIYNSVGFIEKIDYT